MQLKFIVILVGGLVLSTALAAVESKKNTSAKVSNKTLQQNSSKDHLKLLQNIHNYNEVFDNYHSGSIPYEHYK